MWIQRLMSARHSSRHCGFTKEYNPNPTMKDFWFKGLRQTHSHVKMTVWHICPSTHHHPSPTSDFWVGATSSVIIHLLPLPKFYHTPLQFHVYSSICLSNLEIPWGKYDWVWEARWVIQEIRGIGIQIIFLFEETERERIQAGRWEGIQGGGLR